MTENTPRTRRVASYPAAVEWIVVNTDTSQVSEETPGDTVSLVSVAFKRPLSDVVADVRRLASKAGESAAVEADDAERFAAIAAEAEANRLPEEV